MSASGKKIKRILWGSVLVLLCIVSVLGIYIYREVSFQNVMTGKQNLQYLDIGTGSSFEDVVRQMLNKKLLVDEKSFRWTAKQMKYVENVKPGRYELKPHMTNKDLVSLLRSGRQTPVNVIFNNIRTKEQLADKIGAQIEAKPEAILNLLNDKDYTGKMGFTTDNILCLFLPNTYECYWNTSADQFIQRMSREYEKFWTPARLKLARNKELSPQEISILASIVQQETNRDDEKPLIAGVYLNRLKKGWKLEADPTLVWALGDFTINRVLNVYKEIDSPYNTYKYKGLPPGPICLPTLASLDGVLNAVSHNYLYFCARDDFSGYHTFSKSYEQHLINARKFQKALDRRGIRA